MPVFAPVMKTLLGIVNYIDVLYLIIVFYQEVRIFSTKRWFAALFIPGLLYSLIVERAANESRKLEVKPE